MTEINTKRLREEATIAIDNHEPHVMVPPMELVALLDALRARLDVAEKAREGIYVASKTRHAPMWKDFRARGWPIRSTWIDEAGPGDSADLSDLWRRCIHEASTARSLVLFREDDDVLKGGWIELGAALASNVPVFAVGIKQFTIAHDKRITHCATVAEAMDCARAALAEIDSGKTQGEGK